MKKFVYSFVEGSRNMAQLLGRKGANLAEMTQIGLPVPFGFTVTTEACGKYYEDGKTISDELETEIFTQLTELESVTGKGFGDTANPLLVSVRPGTARYVPGVMKTILNLGMNDEIAAGLADASGDADFAYDAYRQFLQMYGACVWKLTNERMHSLLEEAGKKTGVLLSKPTEKVGLASLTSCFRQLLEQESGQKFPAAPKEQLRAALRAAFDSWGSMRAAGYRRLYNIPQKAGLAVSVQAMAFGNADAASCIGIASTRNPQSGKKELCGQIFTRTCGEGGESRREMQPLSLLETRQPEAYRQFVKIAELLEKHYLDMQDIEFVIERGRICMLQTTSSKRTAAAALRTAVDMEKEGLIDRRAALSRIQPAQIEQLLDSVTGVAEAEDDLARDFLIVMKWADEIRTLKIRMNVDHWEDAERGAFFGAEGIGLCRTEKMFQGEDRSEAVRALFFSDTEEKRKAALAKLLALQTADFHAIFEMIGDAPVAVRLLDAPPYPNVNQAFGFRGSRLAVAHPEITAMQTEAIFTAALALKKEKGIELVPEIIIPLVGMEKEFSFVKKLVSDAAARCFEKLGDSLDFRIGTMIEVPRAALTADELAREAEFFSFGMNDLTQLAFGLSREEAGGVMQSYQKNYIYDANPFKTIDEGGTGKLVRMAVELGRSVRPNLRLGFCGDQAEDPKTIEFCYGLGLSYISCPPRKVPTVKLAAAQAVIKSDVSRNA